MVKKIARCVSSICAPDRREVKRRRRAPSLVSLSVDTCHGLLAFYSRAVHTMDRALRGGGGMISDEALWMEDT